MYDAIFLQFSQLLGEHFLGDPIEGPKQLGKTFLSLKELP
jgi:hypothetical protein